MANSCLHKFLFCNKETASQNMPENPDQTSDLKSITQIPKNNDNIALHNITVYSYLLYAAMLIHAAYSATYIIH